MHCIKIRKYCTRAILVLSLSLQIKATNILLIDPKKDGDCGFEAIALQRHILGFQDTAQSLRKIIAKTYQDRYNLIHDEDIKVFLSDRLASENELRVRANKERLPDIVSLIQEIQKPATDVFTPIFMHDEDVTTLANALNLSIVVYIKDKKIPFSYGLEEPLLNLYLSNNHFQCFVMDDNSLPDKTVLEKLIKQQQELDPNAEDIKNIKALTNIGNEIQTSNDITNHLINFENQMKNISAELTDKVRIIINNYTSSNDLDSLRKVISNMIEDIENTRKNNYQQRVQLYRENGSFINYSSIGIKDFQEKNKNIEVLDETFTIFVDGKVQNDNSQDIADDLDSSLSNPGDKKEDNNLDDTFIILVDGNVQEDNSHNAEDDEPSIPSDLENHEEQSHNIIINEKSSANTNVATLRALASHSNSQNNSHDRSTASSAEDTNEILGSTAILGNSEPVISLSTIYTNPQSFIDSNLPTSTYNINKLSPLLIKKWHGAHLSHHVATLHENHINIVNRMVNASQLRQGVGASEDYNNNSMGLWIRSNYGFGSSKITESNLPYEANNQYNTNNIGATIGLDFGQAHDKMLGLAYSYNTGNINYKAPKKINMAKDKLQTNLFSLYGLYYVNNPLHVNALLSYGISTVTKEKFQNLSTPLSGKVKMFDALISLGYDFILADRLAFVPSIGFEYLNYNQDKLSDTKKIHSLDAVKMNKLRLVTELSITYASNFEKLAMHFDVHGKFYQDLNNKVKISTPNTPIVMESSNDVILPRSNFNLGASLVLDFQDNVNLGIGYDYYANKDLNYNSVFLKAKLSF